MGMQYVDSNGSQITEWFDSMADLKKRKRAVEQAGGKVTRIVEVHTNPRYPASHQGKQEAERRRKRAEIQNAKLATVAR